MDIKDYRLPDKAFQKKGICCKCVLHLDTVCFVVLSKENESLAAVTGPYLTVKRCARCKTSLWRRTNATRRRPYVARSDLLVCPSVRRSDTSNLQ